MTLILTTSTSEAYSFVFRLLCNPGDAVLVPTPSYPLFDFLAEIQDVKLFPYELVYDHGWQIEVASLFAAIERASAAGARPRAILVVHPNNPTGSFIHPHEQQLLGDVCAEHDMAIIADEVFLDYSLQPQPALTFAANDDALTFTLSGLSKISGLPQMKVAWIAVSGPTTLKRDALARLEVIADTYLSMNAPVQARACLRCWTSASSIQRQLLQRVRGPTCANWIPARGQKSLSAPASRRRLVRDFAGSCTTVRMRNWRSQYLEEKNVLVQPGHFYDFALQTVIW